MNYLNLGKTDIKISKLGFGAWAIGGGTWWGNVDDELSKTTIHQALELGFNLIDTAPVYGFGHSENIVGQAVKDRRDKVIISTKCGLNWDTARHGSPQLSRDGYNISRNLSADSIQVDLDESLKRLGTDYIDIYITHWQSAPDFPTPISETMGKLMEMKQAGKIRAIGASNVDADILREYLKYGQLDIIQQRYSMLDRKDEPLLKLCEEHDISFMAYSPLEQGLFTGKFTRDYKIPEGSVREMRVWFRPQNFKLAWDMMDKWQPICEQYSCTMSQLAIAWTAAQSPNLQVLTGARKPEQVKDNAGGANINLSPETIALMRSLAESITPIE